MNSKRLGCLSPIAILSGFTALIILLAIEVISGNSIFSPGALNAQAGPMLGGITSHADLGKDCGACHPSLLSGRTMSDLCLTCHSNIQAEIQDSTSLHGVFAKSGVLTCQSCHTEHKGPNGPLTVMSSISFPHETTGFALTAHQTRSPGVPFMCSDCHTESIARFDQQICADCHRTLDIVFTTAHRLEFGDDCLACHDGHDRFSDFDHSKAPFALTGKHLGPACSACHLDARTVADLQNTPAACESCHLEDDAHQGRFGTNCGVCHSPEGWEPAKFDHNLAAFKLEGQHASVKCEQCHLNGVFAGTPQDCYSCHAQDDEHNGQFGKDCAACHTPQTWDDAKVDHNLFAFKLEGQHARVKCEQCHLNGVFAGTPQDCYSCHAQDDEHNGQFGKDCAACHTPTNWENATFDHSLSAFPLTGAHVNVACQECHVNNQFKGLSSACVNCHADPPFHAGAFGNACQSCHNTAAWAPASFNLSHPQPAVDEHGSGIFHGGASCRTCHPSTVYTYTCLSCHSDNQGGEGGEGHEGGDDD